MGRYENAYAEFKAKYDLDLNIQTEYVGAKLITPIDDFATETSPEENARNVYMSTLSSALTFYINKRLKMESEKSYDLSNFDLHDFITEFDKVMEAIRSDKAEEEKTKYTHRKFEGLPLDSVANDAWNRVAPRYNKTLPTLWKERIRAGSMKIEDMVQITNSLYTRLAPIDMDGIDKTQLQDELKTIVAAHEAMRQVRETRKGFFGFFWRIFNREQNKNEVAYLGRLQVQIAMLEQKDYDVDSVTNALNGKNILSREVPSATNVKEAEHEEEVEEIEETNEVHPIQAYINKQKQQQQKQSYNDNFDDELDNNLDNNLDNSFDDDSEDDSEEEELDSDAYKKRRLENQIKNDLTFGFNSFTKQFGHLPFAEQCKKAMEFDHVLTAKNVITEIFDYGKANTFYKFTGAFNIINNIVPFVVKTNEKVDSAPNMNEKNKIMEDTAREIFGKVYSGFGTESGMTTENKIIAAQRVTNFLLNAYSPAAFDKKNFGKYSESFVVKNRADVEMVLRLAEDPIRNEKEEIDKVLQSVNEELGLENKIRLGDQIKNDIEERPVASSRKIEESPVITNPDKNLI